MSTPKHTPGPWRFSRDGYIVSSTTGERVCSPHSTLLGGKISDQIKDLKRNARLIAAAPELLEALRALQNIPPFDGTTATSTIRREAKRAARAAIAKATGEQA